MDFAWLIYYNVVNKTSDVKSAFQKRIFEFKMRVKGQTQYLILC